MNTRNWFVVPLTWLLGFASYAMAAPVPIEQNPLPGMDLYGDPLPPGAFSRIGTIRLRNCAEITQMALSRDSKLLVTSDNSGPISIWNAVSGALVRKIPFTPDETMIDPPERPQREEIIAMAFHTNSSRLYVLTNKACLRVCNLDSGAWEQPAARTERQIIAPVHPSGWVSPDQRHFAYMARDHWSGIEVFAIGKEKPLITIEEPKLPMSVFQQSLSISSDNRFLVALLEDGTTRLWDLKTGQVLSTQKPPVGVFYRVAISPDGKTLVGVCGPNGNTFNANSSGAFLYAWDRESGKELFRTPGWESLYVAYSPDGRRLIGFRRKDVNEVLVADANTGKLIQHLLGHGTGYISGHTFSMDGKQLVTGSRDHTAIVWDLESGKPGIDFHTPRGIVDVLAFSSDGKSLFAGCSNDRNGGLWDAETGKLRRWVVCDGNGNPQTVKFTSDGTGILIGYGLPGSGIGTSWSARLYGVSDGKIVHDFCSQHTEGVSVVAISQDSKQLATLDNGGKVLLWNLENGKLTREIDWQYQPKRMSLTFTSDEELIGASRTNGSKNTEVFNLTSGKMLLHLKHLGVNTLALSPDGRLLAVLESTPKKNGERCIVLYDIASGKTVRTLLTGQVSAISVLAFSPDGRSIAITETPTNGGPHNKDAVHLFDVETGKLLRKIQGHNGWIAAIAFSPDGKKLATGGWDCTALVWDLTAKP
jgi:WD40 repeat protein